MRTEKGKRKTKKKRHTMLFQIGAVLLPMFILLSAGISWIRISFGHQLLP